MQTWRRVAEALVADGLAYGTSGNLSCRLDASRFAVTPSGVRFEELTDTDLVTVDIASGQWLGAQVPSSETPLHRAIYQARDDVEAIVHTHSAYATVFACLQRPILAVHYQIAHIGDKIPVANYATYGTDALGQEAVAALGLKGRAVLLQNHGVIAVGASLQEAYQTARDVEWLAALYWRTLQVGEPALLGHDELNRVRQQLRGYGQPSH